MRRVEVQTKETQRQRQAIGGNGRGTVSEEYLLSRKAGKFGKALKEETDSLARH